MTLKMVLFVRLKPMRLGPPTEEGTLVPFNENYLIGVGGGGVGARECDGVS